MQSQTMKLPSNDKKSKCIRRLKSTQNSINCVLNNKLYIAFMTIVTLYVLFVDDFRVLVLPKKIDDIFMSLNCISLALFIVEIVLNSVSIKGYFLQFYFWLDLIATISLVSDITWIWYPIVGINDNMEKAFDETGKFNANLLITNSSSAASRVSRIMKIIRLVRLI